MAEWECPECHFELVALDEVALRPGIREHMAEHEEGDGDD